MQTRPKGIGLARGRVEGRDLRDLENLLSKKKYKKLRRKITSVVGSALGGKIWTVESTSMHIGGESAMRVYLNR
jgi:hypothetical protein